ncbi:hypothetical protein [Candidatus Thiosymbion oneisti]|uniref:hypothetical protein n=1 Tax=Candidatus Thiosymbion oneisti TaxID=589554 RepID=UPI0013FD6AFC|nr:hypothetical protein [Candidatus Thiosymbion oneisti]
MHDRIALLRSQLEGLPDDHPIRPTLDRQIERWMEQLPEANRSYWRRRMSPQDRRLG